MLILSRRPDEEIVLDVPPTAVAQRITIQVCSISGKQVRLGFEAPKEIGVNRREIQDKIDSNAPALAAD